jgi:magnesium transporter
VFVLVNALRFSNRVETRRLGLFFGDGFVVTFQEEPLPELAPVRERLRLGRGQIRDRGADYLAYAIVDAVIDRYFSVLEEFDDHLEGVEDEVVEARGADPIESTRSARQDLARIRHAIFPIREVVASLLRDDFELVTDETRLYLRDCYDHVKQLQEMVEASREIASALLEAYLSSVSLRTNRAMKVLTVIATVFIPLTFITGVYGMNFHTERSPLNMPELDWYFGYPFSLLLMAATVVFVLVFLRKRVD